MTTDAAAPHASAEAGIITNPTGPWTTNERQLRTLLARSMFPIVEKAHDEATADLLTQRLQVHERTAWMLRRLLAQFTQPPGHRHIGNLADRRYSAFIPT